MTKRIVLDYPDNPAHQPKPPVDPVLDPLIDDFLASLAEPGPLLTIVDEPAGLYAVASAPESHEILGVIGPMDDRDAIMAAAVERWPNIDHIDIDDDERPAFLDSDEPVEPPARIMRPKK